MKEQALRGPYASNAMDLLRVAYGLTMDEARRLSKAWEQDDNPAYLSLCALVEEALVNSGRKVPSGWLEDYFADLTWTSTTKALDAIADAVMVVLVQDLIPQPIVQALIAPWLSIQKYNPMKVDLSNHHSSMIV